MKTMNDKYRDIHAYLEFEARRIQEDILDLRLTYARSSLSENNADVFTERWRRIRMAQMDLADDRAKMLNMMAKGQVDDV